MMVNARLRRRVFGGHADLTIPCETSPPAALCTRPASRLLGVLDLAAVFNVRGCAACCSPTAAPSRRTRDELVIRWLKIEVAKRTNTAVSVLVEHKISAKLCSVKNFGWQ
ncbi:hypothetical protein [Bordetella ansorpii]|uniref:hypothetical protein n=1 Tax=Bordetella ansorpii TaxID=288768 RepID=UPI0012E73512|nr:hypothetical protein [Bordetella ansorpii]